MKITAEDYNHDWNKSEVKTIVLECHPYPDVRPTHDGGYLVEYDRLSPWDTKVSTLSWKGKDWIFDGDKVVSWAEMPESLTDGT